MMKRILSTALMVLALMWPQWAPAHAQIPAPPTGFLMQGSTFAAERLCPGGTARFHLTFFDNSEAGRAAYGAAIQIPIPANATYAGDDNPDMELDRTGKMLLWSFRVDPSQPSPEPPTATYSVTVNSGVVDGTGLTSAATGQLDGDTEVGATTVATVHCDSASEPPRDPAEFPTLEQTETAEVLGETAALLTAADLESDAPSAESLLSDPEMGDDLPPGYLPFDLFLPTIVGSNPAMRTAAEADGLPILGAPICDYVYPWGSRHGMSEAVYQSDATKWDAANYRPIAVSVNGNGSSARFSSLWIKDNKYGKNWSLKHAMTGADYGTFFTQFGDNGFVPTVIDLYGTPAAPRYAAIWVKENKPTRSHHGINATQMQTEIDKAAADGLRPLWVSGLGAGNSAPIFAGLWVKDSYTGTMRIGLTTKDISYEGVARSMADTGYRMVHLSGYETPDGIRYAAVWTKGGDCTDARWEAFRDQSSTQYQIKASAQRTVSSIKTVAAATVALNQSDLGAGFRIARVALRHDFGAGQAAELAQISAGNGVSFKNGDILVLQVEPNHIVTVQERANGNIRLRRPAYPGADGQFLSLNDAQYRLILQFNSSLNRWVELQRNGISPDYYWPTSIDEYSSGNTRLYNSVWQAGPVDRTWRVTGRPQGSDALAAFDLAMQQYMQRRNVPNAGVAVTVDGRLVLARGYSWQDAALTATPPDALYRLASVSKPLTAIGIMRLVAQRKLSLDTKIKDIPGFDAVLKSNSWSDSHIKTVTVRQLLHHQAGWDRDLTPDPMLRDWDVCSFSNPDALPTTESKILDYTRSIKFDHAPGTAHAYSNYGYMLLGLIIETVSGKSYANFMRDEVLIPVGAQKSGLGDNAGTGSKEVRYYTPNNRMANSVLGYINFIPENVQICNPDHAVTVPSSYGSFNITPMAAHGAWIASGVDLAKIMVGAQDGTLLNTTLRNQMWSRPDGRSRRVMTYNNATHQYVDVTLAARSTAAPVAAFVPLDDLGDLWIVGKGLDKFSKIDVKLSSAGAGYDLKFIYPTYSGAWKFLSAETHALADDTSGLSKDGAIRFTAPVDRKPVVLPSIDGKPRYYLIGFTQTKPNKIAFVDLALPPGENGYALGWGASEVSSSLSYLNRIGTLAVNAVIVGEQSKAAAKISSVANDTTTSGVLTLGSISGGPFYAGEKLLIGNTVVATAADRDWSLNADTSHGGLLWGTRAFIQHRRDGVNWVILLNQENVYDP